MNGYSGEYNHSPVTAQQGGDPGKAPASRSSVPDFADIKTEQAVLAAILSEPSSLNTVVSILGGISDPDGANKKVKTAPGDGQNSYFQRASRMLFRDPKHAMIYEAILELQAKQNSVDALSLSEHLQRMGRLEMIGANFKNVVISGMVSDIGGVGGSGDVGVLSAPPKADIID